jgi:predicted transcriptional regulator of viral defense system
MKISAADKASNIFMQHAGTLRTSQAIRLGIAPRTLYAMRDSGILVEQTRGLFHLADSQPAEHFDLVQVALKVRKGVICLISALSFHNLTVQIPHQVYVALPLDAEKPRLSYPPVRFFWLSQSSYSSGIEEYLLEGTIVQIYSREKTIADCFKYRNKIGKDVALEALKEGIRQGCAPEKVMEFARIDRVGKIIAPYLEAIL